MFRNFSPIIIQKQKFLGILLAAVTTSFAQSLEILRSLAPFLIMRKFLINNLNGEFITFLFIHRICNIYLQLNKAKKAIKFFLYNWSIPCNLANFK